LAVARAFSPSHYPPLEDCLFNSSIPMADYKMKDFQEKNEFDDAKKGKGLLVIFSCNTCPYVKLSAGRIKEYSDYCLAWHWLRHINSNEDKGTRMTAR